MTFQTCKECQRSLSHEAFGRNTGGRAGYRSRCRECRYRYEDDRKIANEEVWRIVGVDPGYSTMGIVLLEDGEYETHELIKRPKTDDYRNQTTGLIHWARYCAEVVHEHWGDPQFSQVAIEGLASYGFAQGRVISPKYLLETVFVAGFLTGTFRGISVKPGAHGKKDIHRYPNALVGPREGAGGKYDGQLKHCRSAYDIALLAWKQIGVPRDE